MQQDISNFLSRNIHDIIVIVSIVATAYVLMQITHKYVKRIVRKSTPDKMFKTKRDQELREKTIIRILNNLVTVIIWIFAILLVLAQLDINLGPLIAGAGIAGVALGFGAQSLVKDMINGMFILVENQYRVGDVVELNGEVSGTVEEFTLRSTVLRNLDGMLQHVPNGEIVLATNMTMDYGKVNLDIVVSYNTDLEKLEKVINDVGEDIAKDPEWKDKVTEAPAFVRVNDFNESGVEIKIIGKTEPVQQWSTTGELRKRLKIAFDKNGIELSVPQRIIHEAKTSKK